MQQSHLIRGYGDHVDGHHGVSTLHSGNFYCFDSLRFKTRTLGALLLCGPTSGCHMTYRRPPELKAFIDEEN